MLSKNVLKILAISLAALLGGCIFVDRDHDHWHHDHWHHDHLEPVVIVH